MTTDFKWLKHCGIQSSFYNQVLHKKRIWKPSFHHYLISVSEDTSSIDLSHRQQQEEVILCVDQQRLSHALLDGNVNYGCNNNYKLIVKYIGLLIVTF